MMRLLLKIPSRLRSDKLFIVLSKYIGLAEQHNKYLIILDTDDPDIEKYKEVQKRFKGKNITWDYGISGSKVAACNRGVTDDIIVLASDDMMPEVKGWDTKIIEAYKTYFADLDGVVHFDDGFQRDKVDTLCIMGRKYYNRFGYIYHPEYKNLWCDVEFTEVAIMLGKYKYMGDGNVIIRHIHPYTVPGTVRDELYKSEDTLETNEYDKKVWKQRRIRKYDLKGIVKDFKPEYNKL